MASDRRVKPSVIYIRNFGGRPELPLESKSFARDARAVLALSDAELSDLMRRVADDSRFLSRSLLEQLAREAMPNLDPKVVRSIASVISHLDRLWRGSDQSLDGVVTGLQESLRDKSKDAVLSADERERFALIVPRVLLDVPGLARQRKAELVAEGTGLPLDEVALYCDARPVFNANRSAIDGMVLLTTLKVVATGQDGLPVVLEARLSEAQVADLAKKAAAATSKLVTIAALMKDKGIPLPAVAGEGEQK
jgi:hypothetical protein